MTTLELLTNNYNYYPRTMIRFCSISYEDMSSIPGDVQALFASGCAPLQQLSSELSSATPDGSVTKEELVTARRMTKSARVALRTGVPARTSFMLEGGSQQTELPLHRIAAVGSGRGRVDRGIEAADRILQRL